jgi:hypothetical protein
VAEGAAADGIDSPNLMLCIADTVQRANFPADGFHDEVAVQLVWTAPDCVNTSARIVRRYRVPLEAQIDMLP